MRSGAGAGRFRSRGKYALVVLGLSLGLCSSWPSGGCIYNHINAYFMPERMLHVSGSEVSTSDGPALLAELRVFDDSLHKASVLNVLQFSF